MPVDQSLVGREFPPTAPLAVTEERVARLRRRHRRRRYDGGPAPATFPIVLAFDAMNAFLEAESIDLFRIVHGEQRFAYERPVVPGDVLDRDADRGRACARSAATTSSAPPARSPTPTAPWSAPTGATLVHRGADA